MRWRQPAHPALAGAIVDSFRESPEVARQQLAPFSADQWKKTWFWLDASGLSIYFLRRAEEANLLNVVDPATLHRLRRQTVDNTDRASALFDEFVVLNRAFLRKRALFANLKGFTLIPDSCPSPELRLQLDLDFLVSGRNLAACQSILEERGYELTGVTSSTWEFKAGHNAEANMEETYHKSRHRSVELHFNLDGMNRTMSAYDERLDRLSIWHGNGHSFPALSAPDQLISQALHIFGHLRSANTRPSWLLEFQRHVHTHRDDLSFWREVRQLSRQNPRVPIAMGVCALITTQLFGPFAPHALKDWAEAAVPNGVRLWLQHYGRQAVLADFPGTKLYLLLDAELPHFFQQTPDTKPARVIPSLRFPRLFPPRPGESPRMRIRHWWLQSCYILFRLRFHLVEGFRHWLEAARWKRFRQSHSGSRIANLHPASPR